MTSTSRRSFLKQGAAGTFAALGWPQVTRSTAAPATPSLEGFRYSMCNETFEGWPQARIFQFLAECGYGGVEIAPFTINTDVTQVGQSERKALRRAAEDADIQIVALHWLLAKTKGLHLTSPDETVRRKTSEYLGELARFCADLGGTVLVFGSPQQRNLKPGVDRFQGMEYAAEVFVGVLPVLEQTGVKLALEPLGPSTTNFMVFAADTLELVRKIDSPCCRLLLDCKAAVAEKESIPALIRKHEKELIHFHANDKNRQGPGMGDMDFEPIFQALREVDFAGWVSVEVFDTSPGPERIARESLQYMRSIESRLRT